MSSQWEIVTKSKKSKKERTVAENGPKLDEILPANQIKTMFANVAKEKNREKKSEKMKPVSPKKQKPAQPAKKPSVPAQSPKPKSLETALNAISPEEVANHMETLKNSFPGSELLWLKGVATYLDSKLHIETDPVFAGKSVHYPSNVMKKVLKNSLEAILSCVSEVNLFYFYDQLLTSMAMDMSKKQPVLGHKILLQMIGQKWPRACSNSFAKSAILVNSYQNMSSIGLSLLWALGQGGFKDITIGMKVFQNIMVPLLEMKNYTKFIVEYMEKILKSADDESKLILPQEEFFATYNIIVGCKTLPRDYQQIFKDCATPLIKKYVQSSSKLANILLRLMRDIEDPQKQPSQIDGCIECLVKSDDCFRIWKMNFKKNTLPSLILVQELNKRWQSLPESFRSSPSVDEFLKVANKLNEDLLVGKKKDPHAENLAKGIKTIQNKSSEDNNVQAKKCSSLCPWLCGIFIVSIAIIGVIIYDVNANGGGYFEKSKTGKFLKDTGAYPYVETAWYKTMSTSARGYKWAEENVPIYYGKVCETLKPYANLSCDLYKILRNGFCQACETIKIFFNDKSPIVIEFIEKYAPGLPQKIQDASISIWSSSVNAYQSGCEFFKTKVFVGSLSPENLNKVLNQTQIAAAQYYSWFHKKVDAYAKIK